MKSFCQQKSRIANTFILFNASVSFKPATLQLRNTKARAGIFFGETDTPELRDFPFRSTEILTYSVTVLELSGCCEEQGSRSLGRPHRPRITVSHLCQYSRKKVQPLPSNEISISTLTKKRQQICLQELFFPKAALNDPFSNISFSDFSLLPG